MEVVSFWRAYEARSRVRSDQSVLEARKERSTSARSSERPTSYEERSAQSFRVLEVTTWEVWHVSLQRYVMEFLGLNLRLVEIVVQSERGKISFCQIL